MYYFGVSGGLDIYFGFCEYLLLMQYLNFVEWLNVLKYKWY